MSKTKILLVVLIGILPLLYIAWKTISVSFLYSSIGEPQSGVKITLQEIAGKNLVVLPEEENYFFDQVKLELALKNIPEKQGEVQIRAFQNFLVSFYPINEKVLSAADLRALLFTGNDTDLPVGSLFYNGDAVSIMQPNNSYRSFFSAELFEKMGYDWNDVIHKPVGFAGNLTEGEVFNYGKAHPDGTFLENGGKIFLVWKERLFEIDKKVNLKEITQTSPIKIDSLKARSFGECKAKSKGNQFNCYLEKESSSQKSNYIFLLDQVKPNDIDKASLKLSSSFSSWSLKNNFVVAIDNIKLRLIKKYRGYIPFI